MILVYTKLVRHFEIFGNFTFDSLRSWKQFHINKSDLIISIKVKYQSRKMKKQQSPSKLNTTESILNSLYERLIQQKDNLDLKDQPQSSPTENKLKQSASMMNPKTSSPISKKQKLFTEPYENNRSFYYFNDTGQKHQHSEKCCIVEKIELNERLRKAKKNQLLLQTYKQEVEYLKKLCLLQSQQIQKLRRMLRIEKQKQAHQIDASQKQKEKDTRLMSKSVKEQPNQIARSKSTWQDSNSRNLSKMGTQHIKNREGRRTSHYKVGKVDKNSKKK